MRRFKRHIKSARRFWYSDRGEGGEKILDFTTLYDLVIANTCFKKEDEHLVHIKTESTSLKQILVLLQVDLVLRINCKVILRET